MSTVPQVDTALLLALMPAILGLVNLIKSFGVTGNALTVASMLIGVALAIMAQLLPAGTFQVIFNGLVLGLAACGLYDISAMMSKSKAA